MKFKGHIAVVALLAICSMGAVAQQAKNEITVQGSGLFTKESKDLGVTNNATKSGGLVVGYQYNVNRWLGVQGTYDYSSNSQKWASGAIDSRLKTNVHAVTGNAVVKIPTTFKLKPYALVGGGALIFDPRNNSTFDKQTRGTFVYGGGADYDLTKRLAVRAQYRGFVYKAADFDNPAWKTDKYTHTAVPSIGLVVKF